MEVPWARELDNSALWNDILHVPTFPFIISRCFEIAYTFLSFNHDQRATSSLSLAGANTYCYSPGRPSAKYTPHCMDCIRTAPILQMMQSKCRCSGSLNRLPECLRSDCITCRGTASPAKKVWILLMNRNGRLIPAERLDLVDFVVDGNRRDDQQPSDQPHYDWGCAAT